MTMIDTVPGTPVWHSIGSPFGHALRLAVRPASRSEEALDRAAAVLSELEPVCGRRNRDSELQRVNCRAGRWTRTSEPFHDVLRAALQVARFTDGLQDPMLCLGFGHGGQAVHPRRTTPYLAAGPRRCVLGRWQNVGVRWDGKVLVPLGHALDLSTAATALAAERIARSVAGDLDADLIVGIGRCGDAAGGAWPATFGPVPSGPAVGGPAAVVDSAGAVATAWGWPRGGLRRFALLGPADSDESRPAGTFWRSVSVEASSVAVAQAAAHAAILLGPAAVGWLTQRQLAARLVHRDGEAVCLGAWPRAD
ncbi:MAG TPA: FAD:protein FMN transferase [Kineosporiaceae bacterium]